MLVIAPLAVVLIIAIGHARLELPGMGLNVMLVAGAYLTLVSLPGGGWLQRAVAGRGGSRPKS